MHGARLCRATGLPGFGQLWQTRGSVGLAHATVPSRMSRMLILMRHAKSGWGDALQPDHERPLNARGRRAAASIGKWLAARGHLPDEALVSSAARTRETWQQLAAQLPTPPEAELVSALYNAPAAGMLRILRRGRGERTLLLGHNPGTTELAAALARHRPAHPHFADFPTGATLVMRFPINDWSLLAPGTGEPCDFITPRELD